MKLSERLRKIADMVPQGAKIADVGTDHAYIPAVLAGAGRIRGAIASDVIEGPLERARETVRRTHTENMVEVRLGDGLKSIAPYEADTVIIAGMGGILISEILDASPETARSAKTLILQPMTGIYELRGYLFGRFEIIEEQIAKEGEKLYLIMSVRPSEKQAEKQRETEEAYFHIGKYLFENRPEHFEEYFEKTAGRLAKKLDGLKKSRGGKEEEIKELEELLEKLYNLYYNGGTENAKGQ